MNARVATRSGTARSVSRPNAVGSDSTEPDGTALSGERAYLARFVKAVAHMVGARPNFMKVAPLWRALGARGAVRQTLVHTGQHYDLKMNDVFFRDLGLPAPDVHLGVGSGSHAEQTANVMVALERLFSEERPDLFSVVGDVNGSLAGALVAAKMQIPLAHVEAGLRSFDRAMPEEVNRVVVDRLADLLLTPSPDADENLLREGVPSERIHFVGNVMIDSLLAFKATAEQLPTLRDLGVQPSRYVVCTLHRPSNVDEPVRLAGLLGALGAISERLPVLFPVHPRTRKMIQDAELDGALHVRPSLRLLEPMGYLEFLALTSHAKLVVTDSGGLQEESTALGVPCLTVRDNTERPITVTVGTNRVIGTDPARLETEACRVLEGDVKEGRVPDLWDGHAAERIARIYEHFLE